MAKAMRMWTAEVRRVQLCDLFLYKERRSESGFSSYWFIKMNIQSILTDIYKLNFGNQTLH